MVESFPDTSADIVYEITEPNGCPSCGADGAIEGHEDIVSDEQNPPVCAGCGEVLSSSVVTRL